MWVFSILKAIFHTVFDAMGYVLFLIGYGLQQIGWAISSRRGTKDLVDFMVGQLSAEGKETYKEMERMRDNEDAD